MGCSPHSWVDFGNDKPEVKRALDVYVSTEQQPAHVPCPQQTDSRHTHTLTAPWIASLSDWSTEVLCLHAASPLETKLGAVPSLVDYNPNFLHQVYSTLFPLGLFVFLAMVLFGSPAWLTILETSLSWESLLPRHLAMTLCPLLSESNFPHRVYCECRFTWRYHIPVDLLLCLHTFSPGGINAPAGSSTALRSQPLGHGSH